MDLEQYIINRIIQLRQSKYQICNTKTRFAGKTEMLQEINCRLAELEHIAMGFGFMYKTGFGEETFEED